MDLVTQGLLVIHQSVETMDGMIVTISYSPKGVRVHDINANIMVASKVKALETKMVGITDDRFSQMAMFADRVAREFVDIDVVVHSIKVWRGNDAVEIVL